MFRTTLHSLFVLAVTISVAAQEQVPQEQAAKETDPSGTWKWERSFGDNQMDYTLRLIQNEHGKVTGTYAVKRNESVREPVELDDVKLDGDKLTFRVRRTRNDQEFTINYDGVISDDGIKGVTKANFGGQDREFEWNAQRVVTLADVVGTWQLRLERNGNVMEPVLKLSKDGEELKGTLSSPRGEREIQDAKIKDNELSFHLTFEREGASMNIAYSGRPRGNAMVGFVESDFGGEPRKTEIVGTRLPEENREPTWISLFDGKTMEGWEKVGNDESVWEVKDGALGGSGPASMLVCTKGPYKNFRYRAEVKISDGGNSGLYFRTTRKPGFSDGYEAQIDSTHTDPIRTGSLYGMCHVYKQLVKPDTWFTYDLEVRDDVWRGREMTRIKITVDDNELYEHLDFELTFKEGYFAFQHHDPGSKVSIRKVEVMPLAD